MRGTPTDIALEPRVLDKVLIIFGVVLVITIRDKITQMLGMIVALAIGVVLWMF